MNKAASILSDITVHMRYARYLPDENRRETWHELVSRNRDMHIKKFPALESEIKQAYQYVFDKKVLPSMRSMQFGGKPIEISPNRIYNCAYMPVDSIFSFNEAMFLLLGGTGVGYSVQRHHIEQLPEIRKPNANRSRRYLIADSIEGWADAVKVLMECYTGVRSDSPNFDYSDIRPKGSLLKTSGGKAPGPQPLRECLVKIENMLQNIDDGEKLSPIQAHDIMCHLADAVLSGGIRRAAMISLFSADDDEMISCKAGDWWASNAQRGRANNSAVLLRHRVTEEFFMDLWKRIQLSGSGEPGIYFSNDKDWGTNPCCEIALRPYQFCNLTEINAATVVDQKDLEERSKVAAFLGTLQATYTDFHYLRNIWRKNTEKDALLGVSMTGIAAGNVLNLDLEMASYAATQENVRVAKILGIKPANRVTCVKPAGTTSLVLGSSSGIHAYHAPFYIRRIRVGKNEAIYSYLNQTNPELVEDDYFKKADGAVISIPQRAPEGAILRDESALDLLERVKEFSIRWVRTGHVDGLNTHNVSATISIKEEEWDEVSQWMWKNRHYYNGLAVLPYDGGTYVQAPFEDTDEETYNSMYELINNINLDNVIETTDETDLSGELACAGGACEI